MTKKILNRNIADIAAESLAGYQMAYKRYYRKPKGNNAVVLRNSRKNKVTLVIGGGSGHEPLFPGFVGTGLADAAACGNVCASPNPELIFNTVKEVEQGKGTLLVYGCYAGDNLNFDMAEEMLQAAGVKTAHVRVWDDCASAPKERITDRRGIAGDVFTIKIAGAACDAGLELEEVLRVTEKARDHISSIGIATSPCTLPGNEKPTFGLGENEIEFGMGLHGEAGIRRTKMMSAEKIVRTMYDMLKDEMGLTAGDEICVLVNGLGSTPLLELNLVFYDLASMLKQDEIMVYDAEIKELCTSQEMGGFSISILKLDEELKKYYDMPCYSPYYAKGSCEVTPVDVVCEDDEEGGWKTEQHEERIPTRSKAGVLNELSAEDVKAMLYYVADQVIENKPYLTEVDSAIGDGDHGTGMALGMERVKQKIEELPEEKDVYRIFHEAGQSMLMSMGGASGVIFGSLYLEGAKNQMASSVLHGHDFILMEKKALAAIKERGKAQVGDKTMVDALEPAVIAMEAVENGSLLDILKAAEKGAKEGMENTKKYIAKFGRAKSLMERAIGYQDAGATSVYLIFKSMRQYIEDAE